MPKLSPDTLIKKIDMFMRYHVEPWFDLESIRWWFSLSGGKDSFAMALGMKEWYEQQGKKLDARGFHINQWSKSPHRHIMEQLPWLQFIEVDAISITQTRLRYQFGDQAPCRKCANIRRELNDELIRTHDNSSGRANFLARGLHLTDTVVSLLWRRSLGNDPVRSLKNRGKGNPLSRLWENTYLVKPLFYAREFETQIYTKAQAIMPCCCGCPACRFPSRRDIVEETIAPIFNDALWEFSTPDLGLFFRTIKNGPRFEELRSQSAPGKEFKYCRLPDEFPRFALEHFKQQMKGKDLSFIRPKLNYQSNLDALGMRRLLGEAPLRELDRIPAPALLQNNSKVSNSHALLISSLGPFWGAASLSKKNRYEAWSLQESIFGLKVQEDWAHTHELVRKYYGRLRDEENNGKDLGFSSVDCSHLSGCGTRGLDHLHNCSNG